MQHLTDTQFEAYIREAIDGLPDTYSQSLANVVITYADQPTPEQREKLRLRHNETLLGLYEGVPLTERGAGYNLVLPDKITLFKLPLLQASHDLQTFKAQLKHTLWHEVAHYYGLGHQRIHELEH